MGCYNASHLFIYFIGDYMENEKSKHSLSMSNRQDLEMTGVSNVVSFNEEEILATTDWGDLMIKGASLNVEVLDLTTGDLRISGNVTALVYSNRTSAKGFFRRVFS